MKNIIDDFDTQVHSDEPSNDSADTESNEDPYGDDRDGWDCPEFDGWTTGKETLRGFFGIGFITPMVKR